MKIILFDKTSRDIPGFAWAIGSFRPGWTRIGAKSWDEAMTEIADDRYGMISQLQLWGHARPGEPLIAGESIPSRFSAVLRTAVTPDSLVWFRSCSVFFGAKGRIFAERTANELGCRIAGHTHVIGPWQSGLYSLRPGVAPTWDVGNGDWMNLKSGWREPRTIFCTRMAVPGGW